MSFCRGCGTTLHETAPTCPHCGAPQNLPAATASTNALWLPITGLIIGILALLAAIGLTEADDDLDVYIGTLMFAGIAIALGAVGTFHHTTGRGMSIAGLVLGILGLLLALAS
ncbi:hypothetical protein ACFO3A_02310 [Comamonas nitrativorans]|uniref:Zinc-ribbon domain-containing protein n=1 Tax=Comamonas nitrativorans TaxID=108437 RepID=A0ABV9GWN4_9BURK